MKYFKLLLWNESFQKVKKILNNFLEFYESEAGLQTGMADV